MRPTAEDYARVDAIEAKLAELDPILKAFCARSGLRFSGRGEMRMWPRRSMSVREEIDRSIYLVMELTVLEAMDRGFYSDMPWSLEAAASLQGFPVDVLTTSIFQGIPYSKLAEVLEQKLEEALALLRTQTRVDILSKGEMLGAPATSEQDSANFEGVAAKFSEFDSIIQKFCARTGALLLPCSTHSLFRAIKEGRNGYMYLRIDAPFREIMNRGFYSEIPCSLEIEIELSTKANQSERLVQKEIFHELVFSKVADVLEKSLEGGLSQLRALMRERGAGKAE
jgi:hypothetical protein